MAKTLVAVLDWGLGHAGRSTHLIRTLKSEGHEVLIASSGSALEFLKLEFPDYPFFTLAAYQPRYSNKNFFLVANLILQIPRFIRVISKEHLQIEELVRKEGIRVVFSDNRYGCYAKSVYSIFIGHQLTLPLSSWLRPFRFLVSQAQAIFLKKFNEVWVPDHQDLYYSGKMGKIFGLHPRYIGLLTRFIPCAEGSEKKFWITAIVSGPEPLRTQFTEQLEKILIQFDLPCCLLTGLPHLASKQIKKKNLTIIGHLPTADLQKIICQSEYIISRSGYSSVLDYATTGSKVIMVPTPGQPEQEYLAQRLSKAGAIVSFNQSDLSATAIKSVLSKVKRHFGKYEPQDLVSALQSINFTSS